ncbi:Transient receptor potential channel pyrexia [Armadillidium vulgare]|nr:Transient receptor potential channel pyrexia [Armadillidium vulgare]
MEKRTTIPTYLIIFRLRHQIPTSSTAISNDVSVKPFSSKQDIINTRMNIAKFEKLDRNLREIVKKKREHLGLTQNLSWSPPTQKKDAPIRPRLYSSNLPRMTKMSRSQRIKKWVEGKHSSDEFEIDEENLLRNEIRAFKDKRESDLVEQRRRWKEFYLQIFKLIWNICIYLQSNFSSLNRMKKVSRSTDRRRHKLIKLPEILESADSESISSTSRLHDMKTVGHSYAGSNQSQTEFNSNRLTALKDKLSSKGQPLMILNLLEARQPIEALRIAQEGHSRVRLDVCLLWSCIYGDAEIAEISLSNGANPEARDAEGFSALHLAAESGSEDIVGILIREGARLIGPLSWDNRGEYTPLMLASKHGFPDIASVLIQKGIDVDAGLHKRKRTALHYAAESGNTECVQILIDAGATINPLLLYSETPLHIAVEEGHSDVVDMLLKAGADVRASRGHTKTTCLHISAQGSYYHITHQLLKAGADPNQEDSSNQTALHIASKSQCYDTVQILLNYKANPNAQDSEGKTPLHTGIFKGSRNFECLKLLLESKANPNIPDNAGYTPLHLAAINDSPYCVKMFLKYDADLTKKTKGGVTALNIILRRTPEVITQIQETLNSAINFIEHDQHYERDGQIQLDFRVLLAGSEDGPECRLLSCFMEEGQKTFLKHPLCETFLYLKWLRVRSFFVFNLIFYMILVVTLTQYLYLILNGTAEYHKKQVNDTIFKSFRNIFKHHSHYNSSEGGNETNERYHLLHERFRVKFETECLEISPEFPILKKSLLYLTWVVLCTLTLKEGFQALDSPKSYLSSLDNILVWPVISGSFVLTVYSQISGVVCPWQFHTAAIILLFTWLELLLLIGRFPLFGLYVNMFGQVTKNFSKFLFTYICLINAFALSFGILFHNQPPFKHRIGRIMKTLVMMTGEIEYNEWFYETRPRLRILYYGTSQFVFALFLLFGTIILMNLLVGLAVSDIQGLQKSAGLDRLVRQTHLIAHFEAFMFSYWLKYILPKGFLNALHSRVLLLNSMYGSIFILNPKTFSNNLLPSDLIENIKRIARNRDHFSRRRNAFAEFRTLSQATQPSGSMEGDISRGIEALKCGLDVLVWETEDQHQELVNLNEKIMSLNSLFLEVIKRRKKKDKKVPLYSDQESNFISCKSDYSSFSPSSESS